MASAMSREAIISYALLLKECTTRLSLARGKLVHSHITQSGHIPDTYLQNILLSLYTKCRRIKEARKVFDEMSHPNVCSWTAIISAYARVNPSQSLDLFRDMLRRRHSLTHYTFSSLIPACQLHGDARTGMAVHAKVIVMGFGDNHFVGSSLIDMYGKWSMVELASKVFGEMRNPDVIICNSMICGYGRAGLVAEAMQFFSRMKDKNMVSWNSMIAVLAQNGKDLQALELFREMLGVFPMPDVKCLTTIVSVITNLGALKNGLEIHAMLLSRGLCIDRFMQSALLDLYCKCGEIENGRRLLFDKITGKDTVMWNTLLSGYVNNSDVENAQKVFDTMPKKNSVSWNIMLSGYAQNGKLGMASEFFMKKIVEDDKGIVTWNILIARFAKEGPYEEVLKLFHMMQCSGVHPDKMTCCSALSACSKLAALEQGKRIHKEIDRLGIKYDGYLMNALLDMYAKCGCMDVALDLFFRMPNKDIVSWTAMIGGYAIHGLGMDALRLFEQMQHEGVKPNSITFMCVLTACCHAGLVEEGCKYFDAMSSVHNISPGTEHYGCVVDLLGRSGRLREAEEIVKRMPMKPNLSVLGALLSACNHNKNVEIGERVAQQMIEMIPDDSAPYVLLSNIYAATERWDGIAKMRKLMRDRGIQKPPGYSWIEINNNVHTFLVDGVDFNCRGSIRQPQVLMSV